MFRTCSFLAPSITLLTILIHPRPELSLSLEEAISTHLPYLQRCESDRLRAATSVLKSFHGAISTLPKLIDGSLERVGQALDLCRPEKDLKAIIERRKCVTLHSLPQLQRHLEALQSF